MPRTGSAKARRATAGTVTAPSPPASYIVRMDQPYSRIADALLDYQYWSPNDPQTDVYDDTGWTLGELGNVQVVRVTDVKVLDAAMERVSGEVRRPAASTAPAPSISSTTTPTPAGHAALSSSRTRRSKRPKSRSKPRARNSIAARSSSRTCRRTT